MLKVIVHAHPELKNKGWETLTQTTISLSQNLRSILFGFSRRHKSYNKQLAVGVKIIKIEALFVCPAHIL